MDDNMPWLRTTLEMNHMGEPSCALELAGTLDALADLLDGMTDENAAQEAYSLLALTGRLRRMSEATIEAGCGQHEWQRACDRLEAQGQTLAELALGVARVAAWVSAARRLIDEIGDHDEHEQDRLAITLLEELDDAQLVAAQCARLGRPDPEFVRQLADAHALVCENAWCFLGAGHYAQAMALLFDEELGSRQPDLMASTAKFMAVLDAVEDMQYQTRYPGAQLLSDAESHGWGQQVQANRRTPTNTARQPADSPPTARLTLGWQPPTLAAAGVPQQAPAAPQILHWAAPPDSPTPGYTARLVLGTRRSEKVCVEVLCDDDGGPATDMTGATVGLVFATAAGQPVEVGANIDHRGQADFPREVLDPHDGQPFELRINGQTWPYQSGEDHP